MLVSASSLPRRGIRKTFPQRQIAPILDLHVEEDVGHEAAHGQRQVDRVVGTGGVAPHALQLVALSPVFLPEVSR